MSTAEVDDIQEIIAQALVAVDILARALHADGARLQATLDAITAHAVAMHPAVQDAGLILLVGGKLVPQSVTGQAPQLLDSRQQNTGSGPCIEAAREQALICIDNMPCDPRWPGFSAAAQTCGVASMLCVPLWVNERTLGALSLYASEPGAFSEYDKKVMETFATLAALALSKAQQREQFTGAIVSRDVIGQAKGIIMERYQVSAEAAFSLLTRLSQEWNVKLYKVARHIAETRQIPDTAID
jgi:GAF domain-containing protein